MREVFSPPPELPQECQFPELSYGILFWVASICYGVTLILVCHNCCFYLCPQKRYKSFYVMSFYVFSIVIVFSRFFNYFFLLIYYYQYPVCDAKTLLIA